MPTKNTPRRVVVEKAKKFEGEIPFGAETFMFEILGLISNAQGTWVLEAHHTKKPGIFTRRIAPAVDPPPPRTAPHVWIVLNPYGDEACLFKLRFPSGSSFDPLETHLLFKKISDRYAQQPTPPRPAPKATAEASPNKTQEPLPAPEASNPPARAPKTKEKPRKAPARASAAPKKRPTKSPQTSKPRAPAARPEAACAQSFEFVLSQDESVTLYIFGSEASFTAYKKVVRERCIQIAASVGKTVESLFDQE